MALIGFFLKSAAQSAYQNFLIEETFHREKIKKYTRPDPVTVSAKYFGSIIN